MFLDSVTVTTTAANIFTFLLILSLVEVMMGFITRNSFSLR